MSLKTHCIKIILLKGTLMKQLIGKNIWFIILLFIANSTLAQNRHVRSEGYWTVGLNGGWAYQQSDIRATSDGYGFGLTLAKNVYSRPNALLSFDVRGRFLYANTFGLDRNPTFGIDNNESVNGTGGIDYTDDPGFVFYNHNTQIGELALEGVFHFNRFRERTHFDISLYGGIGLNYYSTKNNWLDSNNETYADGFTDITLNSNASNIKRQLENILDDTYETRADGFNNAGKLNFMPSLGVELYYWFTPKFALGLGHRATWARRDNLDGQIWDNNNQLTAENDLYHYTSIGAKWIIEPRRRILSEPYINIIDPQVDPYNSPTSDGFVRAEIKNANANEVRCFVNGRSANFDMYGENFSVSFPLRAGQNQVRITASTRGGEAVAEQTIIFQDTYVPSNPPNNTPNGNRPYISFTNPPQQNYTSNTPNFTIRAIVENVNRSGDIQVILNGNRLRNFNFDNRNQTVNANVNLNNGQNTITIKARNTFGTEEQSTSVFYQGGNVNTARPSVRITRPNQDPFVSRDRRVNIEATIKNISSRYDISYYINGRVSDDFNFNERRGRFESTIDLREGNNKIVIEAEGIERASDQTTIVYERYTPPPPPPPTSNIARPNVRITNVSTPTSSNCRTTITATVSNVTNRNNILFTIDGQRVNNFDFNPNTARFQSTLNINRGQNTIVIEGQNQSGQDSDSRRVTCSAGDVISGGNSSKPSVVITTPSQQSTTTNKSKATIKATIKNIDTKNDISFRLNGQRVKNFTYNTSTDKFSANVDLKSGNNDIIIQATNKLGRGTDDAAIRYIREIGSSSTPKPPKVAISKPSNNTTITTSTTELKAGILNVSSKSGITVIVNGSNLSNFTYNNGSLNATINLKSGSNKITVKAKNSDGQAEESVTVRYNAPKPAPSVVFTKPRNNATVEIAKMTVLATVKNAIKKDLTFTVNGRKNTNFSLNKSSFSATVTLKEGKNTLQLKVNNAGGSDVANLVINYKPKVLVAKPTVKITKPARSGSKTEESTYRVEGIVKNVTKKEDITLKINGTVVRRFDFNARSGVVATTANLKLGKNTIVLTAKNSAGTGTANSSIIQERTMVAANPPTVKIESASEPTINPLNPGVARSSIIAKIKNVRSKSAITFTVNGKKITNFEFNVRSGLFKAVIDLKEGANVIIVKATNPDGTDQDQKTVDF